MAKNKSKKSLRHLAAKAGASLVDVKTNPVMQGNAKVFKDTLGLNSHPIGNMDIPGYEEINHPQHYNNLPNGIECIDVIEHMPANIALGMKHLWRAGEKPGQSTVKDLDKALWYIQRQKNLLTGNVGSMTK